MSGSDTSGSVEGAETGVLGRGLVNVASLQVGWFACVLGAAGGYFWLGPVVVFVLVAMHLRSSTDRKRDWELVLGLGLVGTVIDSFLSSLGLLSFAGAATSWLCPLWITALWVHFGTQRETLLRLAAEKPTWLALVGAVGGPLAYSAGVKLGAAAFHPVDTWRSLVALGVVWAFVMPLAGYFAWRPGKGGDFEGEDARKEGGGPASPFEAVA